MGYFQGGNISSGAIIHEENFHECMAVTNMHCYTYFSNFTGKIFTNQAQFAKFVKFSPLENNPLYGIATLKFFVFSAESQM